MVPESAPESEKKKVGRMVHWMVPESAPESEKKKVGRMVHWKGS